MRDGMIVSIPASEDPDMAEHKKLLDAFKSGEPIEITINGVPGLYYVVAWCTDSGSPVASDYHLRPADIRGKDWP